MSVPDMPTGDDELDDQIRAYQAGQLDADGTERLLVRLAGRIGLKLYPDAAPALIRFTARLKWRRAEKDR
jgi:hypothetical protein